MYSFILIISVLLVSNYVPIGNRNLARILMFSQLSLVLMKHHIMKTYGILELYHHSFLTLPLDTSGGQLHVLLSKLAVRPSYVNGHTS